MYLGGIARTEKASSHDMLCTYVSHAHEETIPSELGYALLIFSICENHKQKNMLYSYALFYALFYKVLSNQKIGQWG